MQTYEESGVNFQYLGLAEYEAFEASVRSAAIASFESKTAKLNATELSLAWRNARPDIVVTDQVHVFVRETKEGAYKALDRSLELAGVASENGPQIINGYDILNAGNLAAMLLGFEMRKKTGRFNPPSAESTANPT